MAWSDPIQLPEVKAVGKVLGCSVNDWAAVVGRGRFAWLPPRQRRLNDRCRHSSAMVPVNLRPADRKADLGNHFGLVALELPVGIENPLARLYATKAWMEAKSSTEGR